MPATIEDAMASQAEDFVAAFTGAGSPVPAGALVDLGDERVRIDVMRWQGQTLTAEDPNALPGLQTMAGLVGGVQTPELAGITFHEVRCRSGLNRVPTASRVPFRWTIKPYRGCNHACAFSCTRMWPWPPGRRRASRSSAEPALRLRSSYDLGLASTPPRPVLSRGAAGLGNEGAEGVRLPAMRLRQAGRGAGIQPGPFLPFRGRHMAGALPGVAVWPPVIAAVARPTYITGAANP